MTFDANGRINRIPRDLQLDDVELARLLVVLGTD
jgi:hypothetical protein